MPAPIAAVVGARMATLHELDTVYGTRDLWWMLEMITVERYNQRVANAHQETAQ